MDPERYAADLIGEDPALARILERSTAAGLPRIAIAPVYGRLLTMLVAASRAERVLEIGTLGGYSALCLARGLPPGGRVLSLELDEAHAAVARESLREAGVGERVEIRVGDAREALRALEGAGERFDFFLIDADKESYPAYLESAIRLARPGALIAADNAIFHGRVLDPSDGSEAARALRTFNRALTGDDRLRAVILPAYDGLAIARVEG